MSIARAFTTRRVKNSVDLKDSSGFLHRSNTTVKAGSIRNKISAPVELLHTTNMLSYNAPDLFPKAASGPTSTKSDDESDSAPTTASTPPTSPDSPFPEKRDTLPEPNHLSCYFTTPKTAPPSSTFPPPEVPAIPQRAPSHTKKSYESLGLNRHRSASRLSEQSSRSVSTKASFTFSRSSSTSTSTSVASSHSSMVAHMPKPTTASVTAPGSPPAPPVSHKKEYSDTHPFGHELAQVSELAEEYASNAGSVSQEDIVPPLPTVVEAERPKPLGPMEAEELELLSRGLRKFSADDYLSEIRGLANAIFAEASRPIAAVWI